MSGFTNVADQQAPDKEPPIGGFLKVLELAHSFIRVLEARSRLRPIAEPAPELQSLKDRVLASVAERRLNSLPPNSLALRGAGLGEHQVSLPRIPDLLDPVPIKDEYLLGELLELNDEDFVCNAYRAILRREPDADGFGLRMRQLRTGQLSKIEILGLIWMSPEGRRQNVRIPGLARAFRVQQWRRIPIIGRLLGILRDVINLPNTVRSLERQEARLFQKERELRRALNSLAASSEQSVLFVAHRAGQSIEGIGDLLLRLDREKASRNLALSLLGQAGLLRGEISRIASALEERASRDELREMAEAMLDCIDELATFASMLSASKADEAKIDSRMRELSGAVDRKADFSVVMEQLRTQEAALLANNGEVAAEVAELRDRIQGKAHEFLAGLADLKSQLQRKVDESVVMEQLRTQQTTLLAGTREVAADIAELRDRVQGKAHEFTAGLADLKSQLQRKADESVLTEGLQQKPDRHEVDLRFRTIEEGLSRLPDSKELDQRFASALSKDRLRAILDVQDHHLDSFYAAFEDRFRGSREEIKARVAVYVPILSDAGAGTRDAPVLDIGCGRGELLELLRESGLIGHGVDSNEILVRRCHDAKLDVVSSDAIEYLKSLPEGSLGGVTAIHLIEHLEFPRLVMMLDAALRALRAGGVAIFETPNPENLIVGSCNFWYDPTHLRPLPPEAVRFLAEARGFARARLERLHPFPEDMVVGGESSELTSRINQTLYGPQDYSLIAFKP